MRMIEAQLDDFKDAAKVAALDPIKLESQIEVRDSA